MLIQETGRYVCSKCGSDYFKKETHYKLSTDHKKLITKDEVPVMDTRLCWRCVDCGEVLKINGF